MISKFEPSIMRPEPDVNWSSCRDWLVYDENGKMHLDMTSGIFTANMGHNNSFVKRSMIRYLNGDKPLSCFTWPNEARRDFIDKLMGMIPESYGFDSCCLYAEGTMANEHAVQIAQKHLGKSRVYSLVGHYHGNSYLLREHASSIAARIVLFEPYRGYDCMPLTKVQIELLKRKQRDGGLIICDEIQAGFGRTGGLFGFECYKDLVPDLVTFGKGVSCGMPLSGVLFNSRLLSNFKSDEYICNTHSGNPLSCIAGLANLEEFERLDLGLVCSDGRRVADILNNIATFKPELIKCVCGVGYAHAVTFASMDVKNAILRNCIESGLLLVNTHKPTIKFAPPLTMPLNWFVKGLSIFEEVVMNYED